MNRKILFVLPLSLILVSCVSQAPLFVGSQVGDRTLDISGCPPFPGPLQECTGDKNDPKVTIYLDTLVVEPMCVNAKNGQKIEFKLESASDIERGSVVLFPEKLANFWWLTGTNRPNKNKITIRVRPNKKSGESLPTEEVKYGILTSNGCVDPRIHVIN